MKRIIWVEDEIETIIDEIIDKKLFDRNLSDADFIKLENLREKDISRRITYLRNKSIYIEPDFNKACKRIFEVKFDIIILDVNFPPVDELTYRTGIIEKAKNIFIQAHASRDEKIRNKFISAFDQICRMEEYSGLLLFIIICLYYEIEQNDPEISQKICIFTGNDKKFQDFMDLLDDQVADRSLYELGIGKYIDCVENRFWNKTDEGWAKIEYFIKYDEFSEILNTYISGKAARLFTDIVKNSESKNDIVIMNGLGGIRLLMNKILEKINSLKSVPEFYNDTMQKRKNYFKTYDKFKPRTFMKWLNYYTYEHPDYLSVNSIINNFLEDIQSICSDFGSAHDSLEDYYLENNSNTNTITTNGYQPTTNTINALIYELKDIILWFGEIMDMNLEDADIND